MKDYKINCVGMNDEQKRLVQDAFFKLGYEYMTAEFQYYNGDYYFAYYDGNIYRMEGENYLYFNEHQNKEITFNELMALANMEEYMKFTKADLKTGMIVQFCSGEIGQVLLHTTNGDIIAGENWFCLSSRTDSELFEESKSYGIQTIYQARSNKFFSLHEAKKSDLCTYEYTIIWERPDPISVQQKAILELEVKQQELIEAAKAIANDIAKLKGNQ